MPNRKQPQYSNEQTQSKIQNSYSPNRLANHSSSRNRCLKSRMAALVLRS
jgi:hypothetical protein